MAEAVSFSADGVALAEGDGAAELARASRRPPPRSPAQTATSKTTSDKATLREGAERGVETSRNLREQIASPLRICFVMVSSPLPALVLPGECWRARPARLIVS